MASNPRLENWWCAAAMDASGKNITIIQRRFDLLASLAKAPFRRIYSRDSGNTWINPSQGGGSEIPDDVSQIGGGLFTSGPAAAVSDDGKKLHVLGRGTDNRMWHISSSNGGKTWDTDWKAIGQGVFTSAPAAAVAGFGMNLHVFGRGNDNRIWHVASSKGGDDWDEDTTWNPIGQGIFSSAPAAAVSGDGKKLHVCGRGKDARMWHTFSSEGGKDWDENTAWDGIEKGVFSSGPAAVVSVDGKKLHVFGRGKEQSSSPVPEDIDITVIPELWRAFSSNNGDSWSPAWKAIGTTIGPP